MTSPGQDDLGRIQDLITWSSDSIRISSISSNTPALQLWPDTPEGGHLANWLYAHFYADCPRLFDALTDPLAALGIRAEDPIFYQTLRAAFPGTGYVDNGWRVTGLDDRATVQVEKDGVTLHADRAEIAFQQCGSCTGVAHTSNIRHCACQLCGGGAEPAGGRHLDCRCARYNQDLFQPRAVSPAR